MASIKNKQEFGDFQTPRELADEICGDLKKSGIRPNSILEPTCGVGNFAAAALAAWKGVKRLQCIDVNPDYIEQARSRIPDKRAHFKAASFFNHDWPKTLAEMDGPILVIGNLPWVTNAKVGALGGTNLPQKSNFQGHAGFDAITGKANFDISEWMLLKMLDWCETQDVVVALMVKIGVARKVLHQAWAQGRSIRSAHIRRVDTKRWFNASVDACMLVFQSGRAEAAPECPVYSETGSKPESVIGFRDGALVGEVRGYDQTRDLIGGSPMRWRSGVKHDCSKVMEFDVNEDGMTNGLGESVNIECEYLYPLFKSSHLANGVIATPKRVLVTQRKVGQETASIAQKAPKTWRYLLQHADLLDARGSTIYKKNGRFAVFGVGEYSFAPYKVAISGLYKTPKFALLSESENKPAMVDDTACFLAFWSRGEAETVATALNSPLAKEFLAVHAFADAKRPYTVEVLSKLNLRRLVEKTIGEQAVPQTLKSAPQRDAQTEMFA